MTVAMWLPLLITAAAGFPLTARCACATLGSELALPPIGAPMLFRFVPVFSGPLVVFFRPITMFFIGLLLVLVVAVVGFFGPGGSGSGRDTDAEMDVLPVLYFFSLLLAGTAVEEPYAVYTVLRERDGFLPVMNSCSMASSGLSRLSGSQRRHRAIKSRNGSSSQRSAFCRVFELGRRRRPFEETVIRGLPWESGIVLRTANLKTVGEITKEQLLPCAFLN